MKECFIEQSFYSSSRLLIERANKIIAEYKAKGFTLTLRQLYYQFVARGELKNTQKEYKRLGEVLNKARLAGWIDWDAIEDRTRWLRHYANWATPEGWLSEQLGDYKEDLWRDQETYCEVWVEKDALVSVVERACGRWRVPFFACRGFVSQSEQYEAGKRLAMQSMYGKRVHVFHLGDHDPSGLDMTRDNQERLSMFADQEINVTRLALNRDQIDQYDPPPNFAKETDSRYAGYAIEHGEESWELDALDPTVIDELVSSAIENVCDVEDFEAKREEEDHNRQRLQRISTNWDTVNEFLDFMDNNGDDSVTL